MLQMPDFSEMGASVTPIVKGRIFHSFSILTNLFGENEKFLQTFWVSLFPTVSPVIFIEFLE